MFIFEYLFDLISLINISDTSPMLTIKSIIEDTDTRAGKIYTFAVLMIGLGVVAVPVGILASSLSKAREMGKTDN